MEERAGERAVCSGAVVCAWPGSNGDSSWQRACTRYETWWIEVLSASSFGPSLSLFRMISVLCSTLLIFVTATFLTPNNPQFYYDIFWDVIGNAPTRISCCCCCCYRRYASQCSSVQA